MNILTNMLRSLYLSPSMAGWFVPLIIASLLIIRNREKFSSTWFFIIILFFLWIMPQFLLSATRGVMWNHYWMPCVIGLAGINASAFLYVITKGDKFYQWACVALLIIWSLNAIRVDIMAITNHGERSRVQQEVVQSVASKISKNGTLAIIADMTFQSELAFSFLYFLGDKGAENTTAYLYDVAKNTDNKREGFIQNFGFPYERNLRDIKPESLDIIVFLSKPRSEDLLWHEWYNPKIFTLECITRPQRYYSIKKLCYDLQEFSIDVAFNNKKN